MRIIKKLDFILDTGKTVTISPNHEYLIKNILVLKNYIDSHKIDSPIPLRVTAIKFIREEYCLSTIEAKDIIDNFMYLLE